MRIKWILVLRDVAITWTFSYFATLFLMLRTISISGNIPPETSMILNLPVLLAFTIAASLGRRQMADRLVHVGVVASIFTLIALPGMLFTIGCTFSYWLNSLWSTTLLVFVSVGLSYALARPPEVDEEKKEANQDNPAPTPTVINSEEHIEFPCPECKERISFKRHHAGLMVNCPKCNEKVIVPEKTASQEPPALPTDTEQDPMK